MNLNSWIRRAADGEYDGLLAFALMGLIFGGLVAISVVMEMTP